MQIIILGAGQVGSSVAETLVDDADNQITVVDQDARKLQELQDRFDLRTVCGNAAHPEVLEQAGAESADLILAVTSSDEVNMAACQIAYTLFHTPTKIARIRAAEYLSRPQIFVQDAIPIDVIISPEQLVTDYIYRLIEYPGALQVLDFAGGVVQLVGVRAYHGGLLVGHELRDLREHLPNVKTRVAAIYRRGAPIIPTGNTVIEADDEVFFIAAKEHIRTVMAELRRVEKLGKNIMLAGGGQIGYRLAKLLEKSHYHTKIVERNPERARQVAEKLDKTIVLQGDIADGSLLVREGIDGIDTFCALTNDDEANILSAMLAKRMGAHRVMSLINRAAYVDLVVGGASIDIAISPQQATIGSLLAYVRRGDVVVVHSLRRGAAEAIEAVVHGDKSSSPLVGRKIGDLKLPPGTTIGAVVRNNEVHMATKNLVIEAQDHMIMFMVDKKYIHDVEKLFQVG